MPLRIRSMFTVFRCLSRALPRTCRASRLGKGLTTCRPRRNLTIKRTRCSLQGLDALLHLNQDLTNIGRSVLVLRKIVNQR